MKTVDKIVYKTDKQIKKGLKAKTETIVKKLNNKISFKDQINQNKRLDNLSKELVKNKTNNKFFNQY